MKSNEQGVSLVEAMIAILIALYVMTSLGGVVFMATVQNKNQGVEASRVTVYAQDKIETLMNLDWYDCIDTAGRRMQHHGDYGYELEPGPESRRDAGFRTHLPYLRRGCRLRGLS